jgi:preprotein translocase subunit SecG
LIYLLYTIYVLACVFLILVILLQSGKGGDVAAAFGGAGSQTAFGPRGAQKPLEKATIIAAITFMLLALIFSLPGVTGGRSVVDDPVETATPTPSPVASVPAVATSPDASPAASVSPTASPAADTKKEEPKASPSATPEKK